MIELFNGSGCKDIVAQFLNSPLFDLFLPIAILISEDDYMGGNTNTHFSSTK